jgi:hypothetical protein
MIERGIGYWITPDDQFVPIPPRVSHADVIRELIDRDGLGEEATEAFLVDANHFAIQCGWTRVRIYPGQGVAYLDLGLGKSKMHLKMAKDLIAQLELSRIAIKHTDEDGNYISP